jgi:hypothetical protein
MCDEGEKVVFDVLSFPLFQDKVISVQSNTYVIITYDPRPFYALASSDTTAPPTAEG